MKRGGVHTRMEVNQARAAPSVPFPTRASGPSLESVGIPIMSLNSLRQVLTRGGMGRVAVASCASVGAQQEMGNSWMLCFGSSVRVWHRYLVSSAVCSYSTLCVVQVSSSAVAREGDVVLDAFSKQQRQYKVCWRAGRSDLTRRVCVWPREENLPLTHSLTHARPVR